LIKSNIAYYLEFSKIIKKFFVLNGLKETFLKILENFYTYFFLGNNSRTEKKFLASDKLVWLQNELLFLSNLEKGFSSKIINQPQPIHYPIAQTESFILKNLHLKLNSQKIIPKKIVVVSTFRTKNWMKACDDTIYINLKFKNKNSIHMFSLCSPVPIASQKSKFRALLLICFIDSVTSVILENNRINEKFFYMYGKLINKYNAADHIKIQKFN